MNAALPDTFAGRSVLVTGHTGFKGSWLTIWLHHLGARVTGYALPPPTTPSNFVASRVRELLTAHHEADVRDARRLTAALRAARPELVFHLAAQSLVRAGYARPRETCEVNIIGTVSVLDAVRALRRPCVVIVTTSDKCYAPRATHAGHVETDPLGGADPYSASKAAAELLIAVYRRSFFPLASVGSHGVKLASVRAGNVIGGGDWAQDRIMTDVVRHLAAGRPVPVRNPTAVRPWQHVLEPLSGYLLLASKLLSSDDSRWSDAWNFGPPPGSDVSVRQLVEMFAAAWGAGRWTNATAPGAPPEAAALRLSIDKALHTLGWRPRWGLKEAVRRTAEWYRRFYGVKAAHMRAACLEDIQAYEQHA